MFNTFQHIHLGRRGFLSRSWKSLTKTVLYGHSWLIRTSRLLSLAVRFAGVLQQHPPPPRRKKIYQTVVIRKQASYFKIRVLKVNLQLYDYQTKITITNKISLKIYYFWADEKNNHKLPACQTSASASTSLSWHLNSFWSLKSCTLQDQTAGKGMRRLSPGPR